VEELILEKWQVMIWDSSQALDSSIKSVHTTVHEEPEYYKECVY
jgi:hypothetical protein